MNSALTFLVEALDDVSDSEITIQSHDSTSLHILVNLKRADQKIVPYELVIKETKNHQVEASEHTPTHLPKFCPERHINFDGTFCLYWKGDLDLSITGIDQARLWWQILIRFLLQQERVKKKRIWPDQNAWAHGQAAKYQQEALLVIKSIGGNFQDAVDKGSINVLYYKTGKGNGSYYQVFRDNALWYVVWERFHRVVRLRQKCLCGAVPKKRHKGTLRSCHNKSHQLLFATFAIHYYRWKTEEERFWACFKGQRCCGTLNVCPLKQI